MMRPTRDASGLAGQRRRTTGSEPTGDTWASRPTSPAVARRPVGVVAVGHQHDVVAELGLAEDERRRRQLLVGVGALDLDLQRLVGQRPWHGGSRSRPCPRWSCRPAACRPTTTTVLATPAGRARRRGRVGPGAPATACRSTGPRRARRWRWPVDRSSFLRRRPHLGERHPHVERRAARPPPAEPRRCAGRLARAGRVRRAGGVSDPGDREVRAPDTSVVVAWPTRSVLQLDVAQPTRARASFSRANDTSRPRTSMASHSGGPTVRPVMATRTGAWALPREISCSSA